jgi:hypothetical protein
MRQHLDIRKQFGFLGYYGFYQFNYAYGSYFVAHNSPDSLDIKDYLLLAIPVINAIQLAKKNFTDGYFLANRVNNPAPLFNFLVSVAIPTFSFFAIFGNVISFSPVVIVAMAIYYAKDFGYLMGSLEAFRSPRELLNPSAVNLTLTPEESDLASLIRQEMNTAMRGHAKFVLSRNQLADIDIDTALEIVAESLSAVFGRQRFYDEMLGIFNNILDGPGSDDEEELSDEEEQFEAEDLDDDEQADLINQNIQPQGNEHIALDVIPANNQIPVAEEQIEEEENDDEQEPLINQVIQPQGNEHIALFIIPANNQANGLIFNHNNVEEDIALNTLYFRAINRAITSVFQNDAQGDNGMIPSIKSLLQQAGLSANNANIVKNNLLHRIKEDLEYRESVWIPNRGDVVGGHPEEVADIMRARYGNQEIMKQIKDRASLDIRADNHNYWRVLGSGVLNFFYPLAFYYGLVNDQKDYFGVLFFANFFSSLHSGYINGLYSEQKFKKNMFDTSLMHIAGSSFLLLLNVWVLGRLINWVSQNYNLVYKSGVEVFNLDKRLMFQTIDFLGSSSLFGYFYCYVSGLHLAMHAGLVTGALASYDTLSREPDHEIETNREIEL